MVANIRSADGAHLAVIVRGTRTALEWQVGKEAAECAVQDNAWLI
jgi:hypothetical protein